LHTYHYGLLRKESSFLFPFCPPGTVRGLRLFPGPGLGFAAFFAHEAGSLFPDPGI
jgi:hypothetical protein